MKKFLIMLLCVGMLLSLVACASSEQATTSSAGEASGYEGLSASVVTALENMGYTEEKWSALSTQEQQAVLTAVYAMLREDATTAPTQSTQAPKYTLEDVEGNGRYMITVADSVMENYFELYYRDGALLRIYVNLSEEGSEENPQIIEISGEEIQTFHLFSIDYTAGATAVVEALKAQGYIRVFIAKR